MSQKLLDEKELQEAINYQIISPSFAERVRELIKAHEQNAAQQSVQADENTAEAFIANFIEFINDAYLHEEDRQKILGFLRERSRR